jgi:5S rRNA maturation endonuclease (ribonuclease M5)
MSTNTERKIEHLTKQFQKLSARGEKGVPIIVEGRKDLSALRKLGVDGRIICVKSSSKVLIDILDDVQGGEVTLFVDFDESGISLASNITQYLEGKGVKVDSIFWKAVRSLIRRDVKDVEGIPSYLEKLKKRASYF